MHEYVALRRPRRPRRETRCGTCLDLRREAKERFEQAITELGSEGWKKWRIIPCFDGREGDVLVFRRQCDD